MEGVGNLAITFLMQLQIPTFVTFGLHQSTIFWQFLMIIGAMSSFGICHDEVREKC